MMIEFSKLNSIIINNIGRGIFGRDLNVITLEKWGLTITSEYRDFYYNVTFESEQHKLMFLMQFGPF